MIGDLDIAGVFLSPLLPCVLLGLLARMAISKVLERTGLYGRVWNRPLFDMALLVVLVGAQCALIHPLV